MPRRSNAIIKRQNREQLVKLISTALRRQPYPESEVARRAGVCSSHLSNFLYGRADFGRKNLEELAHTLRLNCQLVLELAGFVSTETLLPSRMPQDEIEQLMLAFERFGLDRRHLMRFQQDHVFAEAVSGTFQTLFESIR